MDQGLIPYNRMQLQLFALVNESLTNIIDNANVKGIEIKIDIDSIQDHWYYLCKFPLSIIHWPFILFPPIFLIFYLFL